MTWFSRKKHLDSLPSEKQLKQEMVEHILQQRTPPRRLQFALSQRIYYEILADGVLFFGSEPSRRHAIAAGSRWAETPPCSLVCL
jgi:hypothetical protein